MSMYGANVYKLVVGRTAADGTQVQRSIFVVEVSVQKAVEWFNKCELPRDSYGYAMLLKSCEAVIQDLEIWR